MRVYQNLPMSSWKVVFPERLLQFRVADALRVDLLSLIGFVSIIGQVRFDSIILQVISLVSISIYVVRLVLGYKRMSDRFENRINQMLVKKTVSGQKGSLTYLTKVAAQQQFAQSALGYLALVQDRFYANEIVDFIWEYGGLNVEFNYKEAEQELCRLGLLRKRGGDVKIMKEYWKQLIEDDEQVI
eukprot:TRINITY_DN3673_c0_g4_i1.p1 TRINITY_DN3673_c0_g4~~TRINITY_DN3673_c0_g4_i1.p1  ORF type:complete len:203 (+),score=15.65 TRINITY_DN3673_c0_g4_i1:53-610(+)